MWSKVGIAQLDQGMVREAIESFCKANDPHQYMRVITAAEGQDAYYELVKFLRMARELLKESMIDGELVYSLAKTQQLNEIEDFIHGSNQANIQQVGDRCYDDRMYEACKILYTSVETTKCLHLLWFILKNISKHLMQQRKPIFQKYGKTLPLHV
ncbi:MAG: hypothetical protein IPK55_13655 [Streptococcus sp.]|nr:hypothetical protein [Streptococcus sp.]